MASATTAIPASTAFNETSLLNNFLTVLGENFFPPFYFALLIGIPSVLLYGAEVFVIVKYYHKDFDYTFYKICAVRAIFSIFGFIASYLNARLPKIGLRFLISFYNALPNFALNIIYFFHFYPFHLENIATVFLLLNRLTSICIPFDYERLWRRYSSLIILLIIILPIPFTVHIFTLEIFLRFQQDNGNATFTLDYRDKPNKPINATIGAWSAVIFMCVSLSLNLACLIAYRVGKGKTAQQNNLTVESRLTKYAIFTFLGQLLMAIYYVLIHQAVNLSIQGWDLPFLAIYNQYGWINDLGTVVAPAWTFLWACSSMKSRIFQMMPQAFHLSPSVSPAMTLN